MKRKVISLILAMSCLTVTITGCSSSFISEDVASYPLETPLTTQEVIDYYSKALDYDAVVSKNITVHKTNYVTQDIEGEKAERLKDLASQAQTILSGNEYILSEQNLRLVSPDTFNYIKCAIDNEVLSNGRVVDITGALGYYFVDMQYDLSPKTPGTFNQLTSLVGLNGAFYENFDGTFSIDTNYMKVIVEKMNEYFLENLIVKNASFDDGTVIFKIEDGVVPVVNTGSFISPSNLPSDTTGQGELESTEGTEEDNAGEGVVDDNLTLPEDPADEAVSNGENAEGTEGTENTNEATEDNTEESDIQPSEDVENNEEGTEENGEDTEIDEANMVDENGNQLSLEDAMAALDGSQTYSSIVAADRKIQFDSSLINEVIGSSLKQKATVPDLSLVYNIPAPEGDISGYGICMAGGNGLKVFGFDRNALAGDITLRYVFKDDPNGTGDIIGKNIFILEENITNGINVASNNVLIPEFLMTEFDKVIERADRVQSNCDISGIMSGHLYEDMGFGILRGFKEKSTGIHKCMSTIRQVINRDTSNNSYLLDVETTTIEGAKDVDCYGTYKDKSYVVVQQQGNEFKIIDWIRTSRNVVSEPSINPDSTIQKRLVALNLAGEIPEESKIAIKDLVSDLYTAGTNRLMRGPKDITVKGQTITLEKGMYDCFQNDTSILSSEQLEYMNSKLRNVLTKHGTDVSAMYSGTVTEWIGGYENQAEFTTEELVTYSGTGDGYYMEVYYLVSKLNDVWVIDERTVLDEKEITESTELENIKSRVGQ